MQEQRQSDATVRTCFRTQRFNNRAGEWYFLTREGTEEGPFEERREAEEYLQRYIKVMASGLLSSDSELKLQPRS